MDHYHIWCDLRPGTKDADFADAIAAFLNHLVAAKQIERWGLQRRKLGLGPEGLGEWHVDIQTRDLAQLDEAFRAVTPRTGKLEKLHAGVWAKVVSPRFGLFRDYPDA